MYRLSVAGVVFALGLTALSPAPAAAQTLYGFDNVNNQLFTINTGTGAATLVANFSIPIKAPGLRFRGSQLYIWDSNTNKLWEVDPATAIAVTSINLGIVSPPTPWIGDLTFRSDGIGFLAMNSKLWSFDITVPNSTPITGALNPNISGMDFNAAGVLYGLAGNVNPKQLLVTINPATGATTVVGSTGLSSALNTGGLAFHPTTGILYGSTGGNLYTISTATGLATLIGNYGPTFGNGSGIAFGPAPAVIVTESGGSTNVVEGGATDNYTVVLTTPPAPGATVTVTVTPDAQETVSLGVLTFTAANWTMAQTVTVTAFNHGVYVPPHTGLITHTAVSTDPAYNGIPVASVVVHITSPLTPPGGAGSAGEGSYAGCADPPSPGGEGGFGFGAGISGEALPARAVLSGPYLGGPGGGQVQAPAAFAAAPAPGSHLRVFNVSGQGNGQAGGGQAGLGAAGALGWAVLAALALVGAVALAKKLRAAGKESW